MKIALDTNCYVDFCRGDELAVDVVRRASFIYLPIVTIAELRAGFYVEIACWKTNGRSSVS